MPNYVYNHLVIIGDNVNAFYNVNKPSRSNHKDNNVDECELSFNMLVPEPDDCNLHNWRLDNWGCKWDANNVSFKMINNKKCEYTFSTPWNYPVAWVKNVSIKYPKLIFVIKYEDECFCFFGTNIIQNGRDRQVEYYIFDDITTYLTVNCEFDMDDLVTIAKKYNYRSSRSHTDPEKYDEFIHELDNYIHFKKIKYGLKYDFRSGDLENIIVNFLENE